MFLEYLKRTLIGCHTTLHYVRRFLSFNWLINHFLRYRAGYWNLTFSIRLRGTRHKMFEPKYEFTYVRAALATTDIQTENTGNLMRSTPRIKTMVLPEQSKSVNRLVSKQLHLIHVVSERTKKVQNLNIELERLKLDHIDSGNLRTSVYKRITFSK